MTIAEMKHHFTHRELGIQGAVGEYAILVPLAQWEGKLCLLFETRAETLVGHQPGEVCFPGGRRERGERPVETALRETWEETGVQAAPVCDGPISLDIFPVAPHEKRGRQVPRHLHLSLAYLLQADDAAPLRQCPAENRAVAWQTPDFLTSAHFSPEDLNLYQKLLDRAQRYLADSGCKSGKNLLK